MTFYMVYIFKTIKTEHNYWPCSGWSWKNIEKDKVWKYLALYVPQALTASSDQWRIAAVGTVCASIGDNELGVFNMSGKLLLIMLTFVGSISSAYGIKIAAALGAGDGELARKRTVTSL